MPQFHHLPVLLRKVALRWAVVLLVSLLRAQLGLADNPAPPFTLRQDAGIWWFVAPGGQPFFSRGVCVVTPGMSRPEFDPENPSYAAWKQYPDTAAWAQAAAGRLRAWNFTTLGAWSEFPALRPATTNSIWLTPVLHLGSTVGAPWWDMWDDRLVQRMDRLARERVLAVRDEPRLLGYYTDNELGWWNATLWKMTLEQPGSSGQRQRLIQLLRHNYGGDWSRLEKDFHVENASGWRELRRHGALYLKPGSQGIRVLRQFVGILAARYYQLTHDLIRKYDRRALILGDRYQSFYYPEVARAAAPWVDAISCNLNANWSDGTYLRCQLDTLHALTQKPILVSEFYMAARENRTGNRNNHGVFPTVATQLQRASGISNTLTRLARTPFVVGADWFQFFDEPRHGRADGENYNFGLVDIHDQPYDEVTQVFSSLDSAQLRREPLRLRDATSGIPPAPADPFANFTPTHALESWDRNRGFVKPISEAPLADLYVSWSPEAIYLGLYALDITEDAFYRDAWVPKQDRALWTVEVEGRPAVHARIGAGREPIPSTPELRIENLSGAHASVRNIATIRLTAAQLGRTRLAAGDTVSFGSTFLSHLQAYRVEWRGTFRLTP